MSRVRHLVPPPVLVLLLPSLLACAPAAGDAPSSSDSGGELVADGGGSPSSDAADDAGPDAGDDSSQGSGGLSCTSQGSLPGDRTYCVASIGGSELKLAEPAGGAGPLRVAVYVHGDGAAAYKSDSAMKALLPWADAHHALVLSVLSPNGCAWWQAPTQTDCSQGATSVADVEGVNADALRLVLEAVRAGYDVSNGPIFYYGSSGGSIFLTRSFLRRFGDRFPGAFALNCGGEKPNRDFAWDVSDPAKRSSTRLSYTYGDQDFLKSDIEAAIPYFEGLGFASESKVIPNAGHCEFNGHGRAVEVWQQYLGE